MAPCFFVTLNPKSGEINAFPHSVQQLLRTASVPSEVKLKSDSGVVIVHLRDAGWHYETSGTIPLGYRSVRNITLTDELYKRRIRRSNRWILCNKMAIGAVPVDTDSLLCETIGIWEWSKDGHDGAFLAYSECICQLLEDLWARESHFEFVCSQEGMTVKISVDKSSARFCSIDLHSGRKRHVRRRTTRYKDALTAWKSEEDARAKREECPICLETIVSEDERYLTKCGHVFHLKCISHPSVVLCPMCRGGLR